MGRSLKPRAVDARDQGAWGGDDAMGQGAAPLVERSLISFFVPRLWGCLLYFLARTPSDNLQTIERGPRANQDPGCLRWSTIAGGKV